MTDESVTVGEYPTTPNQRVALQIDWAPMLTGAQVVTSPEATLVELPSRTDVSASFLETPVDMAGTTTTAWVKKGLVRGRTYELALMMTAAVPAGPVGPSYERRITVKCV